MGLVSGHGLVRSQWSEPGPVSQPGLLPLGLELLPKWIISSHLTQRARAESPGESFPAGHHPEGKAPSHPGFSAVPRQLRSDSQLHSHVWQQEQSLRASCPTLEKATMSRVREWQLPQVRNTSPRAAQPTGAKHGLVTCQAAAGSDSHGHLSAGSDPTCTGAAVFCMENGVGLQVLQEVSGGPVSVSNAGVLRLAPVIGCPHWVDMEWPVHLAGQDPACHSHLGTLRSLPCDNAAQV